MLLECDILKGFSIQLTSAVIVETAALLIINPDWWMHILTYRHGRWFTWYMLCYYSSIITCFCDAVV